MMKIIVANWKMHGDIESSRIWTKDILQNMSKTPSNTQVVVCPPAPLLPLLNYALHGSQIKLGGQDCYSQIEGAYTGEISAKLLKDIGCEYVIVGHSERRNYFKETNELVRAKAQQAIKTGIMPIICIGETEQERAAGKTLPVIEQQIKESIPSEAQKGNFILAYEPVWAIGSGNLPTMDEIKEVHTVITKNVSKLKTIDITDVCVLYGGSVKSGNAGEILALANVSGVLVGGASLNADEFFRIISSS